MHRDAGVYPAWKDRNGHRASRRWGDPLLITLESREDEEDQAEHEGHVDAAMGSFAQQTESCRVVMEERERQQQARDEPGGPRRQRAEAHLGIEFFLETAVLDDHIGFG